MKLHATIQNENCKIVSKGGNEKLTIGLNVGNKNIATIDFTEDDIRIWYEGNRYWSADISTGKKKKDETCENCVTKNGWTAFCKKHGTH